MSVSSCFVEELSISTSSCIGFCIGCTWYSVVLKVAAADNGSKLYCGSSCAICACMIPGPLSTSTVLGLRNSSRETPLLSVRKSASWRLGGTVGIKPVCPHCCAYSCRFMSMHGSSLFSRIWPFAHPKEQNPRTSNRNPVVVDCTGIRIGLVA